MPNRRQATHRLRVTLTSHAVANDPAGPCLFAENRGLVGIARVDTVEAIELPGFNIAKGRAGHDFDSHGNRLRRGLRRGGPATAAPQAHSVVPTEFARRKSPSRGEAGQGDRAESEAIASCKLISVSASGHLGATRGLR